MQLAIADRREARLRPADRLPAADRDGAHRGLVAGDHRGETDVDRLRCEHQARAAEATDLEVGAAAAIALPGIVEAPARDAGEVEARPAEVEHFERHGLQLGMDFRPRAAAPGKDRSPAGEGDAGRRQLPSVAGPREHGCLVEDQRPPLDRALARQPDLDRAKRWPSVLNSNAAPRRPANRARTCPVPFTSFALAVSRASVMPLICSPRASTEPSSVVRPSARMTLPSTRPARTASDGKAHVACPQMRFDLLRVADRGEAKRPVQPAAGHIERAGEAAGIGAKVSARARSADVQRGNRNDRASPARKQDPAIAGERAEAGLTVGAIIEARGGRDRAAAACRAGRASRSDVRGRAGRAGARYGRRASSAAVRRSPAGRARRCGRCRRGCGGPRPSAAAWANRTACPVKWRMPSGPRSSRVSMRGRPPVRLAKKLLSRRRTQALPVPTTREPLPPGPGTTFSSDWTSTIPSPSMK